MVKKTEVDESVEVAWGHTGQNGSENLEYLSEEDYFVTWWNGRYEDVELSPRLPRHGKGNLPSRDLYGNGRHRKHKRGKKDRQSIRKDDQD